MKDPRQAIVDIGSNSIRLVVFGGPLRAPSLLFNEKLMAGLGRGVVAAGRLDPESVSMALTGLARFAALIKLMKPGWVRVVATAAVREASDGGDFLKAVRKLDLPAELLSGDDEAEASGLGVISAHPQARGLVADMGGGSLELVRVADGAVHEKVSLLFGAMRVAAIRSGGRGQLRKALRKATEPHRWLSGVKGQPLYLVGGAWRALARVHMMRSDFPLPVLGDYSFSAADARELKLHVRAMSSSELAAVPGVKAARALQLDDAAALLAALVLVTDPSEVIVSAHGLREGLLYQALDPRLRRLDPLIEGIRHALAGQQAVDGHADALLAWSDELFADDPAEERRLRHAACLIAGTSWASDPDFRAVAGEDIALHGNWIGVNAADRAVMAMALHVGLGGAPDSPPAILARLAPAERLDRARAWGFALRLAQRLSGGSPAALRQVPLHRDAEGTLVLAPKKAAAALVDGAIERRLARLGTALRQSVRVEFST
jgi:exopolyphosphatase/guanosine-5'-triphosphate,3'-diphosphate pyrophosphatase